MPSQLHYSKSKASPKGIEIVLNMLINGLTLIPSDFTTMLSFYFKSLAFKNPLAQKKQLYISVELAEGAPRTTETVSYFTRTHMAIFSETLEFTVKNPQENTFFYLEIYEETEKSPQTKQRICRETIHLNKMVTNNTKELQVNTTYGPAFIELDLDLSDEFNEMVLGQDKPLPKDQTHRREQALNLDSFNLIKMAPLMYEFVLALTPLVLLKRDVIAFFTWKDPHKTLFASLALSIFLLFNQKLIAVSLLGFFLFSKRLIPILLQAKPIHDELKGTLQIYKRNMVMMRELMQVTIWIDELQNKLFNDPDKTLLLHILLFVKRFAPILSIGLFFGDITKLLVLGYWTFLLYHTDVGARVIGTSYKILSDFLDSLSILLIPIEKLEQLLTGQDLKTKKLEATGCSTRSSLHANLLFLDSPHNSQDPVTNTDQKKVVRQKTFITYENQRWWIGKGWCTKMLGNERPSWSDDLGKASLNRDSFNLPGPNWVWDTDWSYVVNSNTDALGWEYANKFSTFNKPGPHKHLMNVVRRRKWARRCVEVQETEEVDTVKVKKSLSIAGTF